MTAPLQDPYRPPVDDLDDVGTARDDLPTTEAPARRQPGTLLELYLEGTPDPVRVRITNRERIHYEKTAAKRRDWPTMAAGQHFAMTFVAWSAAQRAGLTSATFEAFEGLLLDYDVIAETPADPTR